MNINSASISCALNARAVPVSEKLPVVGKRLTSVAVLGGVYELAFTNADIAYVIHGVAAAVGNHYEVNLLTGAVTLTGSPVMSGVGVDFSGVDLPAADAVFAIRLAAPVTNDTPIAVTITVGGLSTSVNVFPGTAILIPLDKVGTLLSPGDHVHVALDLSTQELSVEVLGTTLLA